MDEQAGMPARPFERSIGLGPERDVFDSLLIAQKSRAAFHS